MAEYVASPSCIKLHMQRSVMKDRPYAHKTSRLRVADRRSSFGRCDILWLSTWKMCKLSVLSVPNMKASPFIRTTSFTSGCWGSLVDLDGMAASNWMPIGDQVLLMASIFLMYMAGVIPLQNSDFSSRKNIPDKTVVLESSTSSGSVLENDYKVNMKHTWDAVKRKLLDSVDAIERGSSLGSGILKCEESQTRTPLSLNAISEGPKLRLLWASFQKLEEEVNNISGNVSMDDWMTIFPEIIRKSCQPACMAWLEKELLKENSNSNQGMVSLMIAKLNGDDTVLQNIRKSGKEDLYAELLYFYIFGSHRKDCCYDHSLFLLHGDSILEDLVITLADGIASSYLELISVDGNLPNEMSSMSLDICNLSTRALQKLRNEVTLNQWLYQNVEAVVSMYEDRFDLHTLQSQIIEQPSRNGTERCSWWNKLTRSKSETVSSPLSYIVLGHFSMPVRRIKELRALTGWRYYFSLFLELSDISMPLIRAILDKVSSAISFFLMTLIGRSLGLIYTGIRQSLRWK